MSAAVSTGTEEVQEPHWRGALAKAWSQEAGRLTIWSPVLLVGGIWAYFALAKEPGWPLVAAVLLICSVAFWRFRQVAGLMAIVILAMGFSLAKLRTEWVATPLVRAYSADVRLTGRVADVERRSAKRMILVIDVDTASGLEPNEVPRRLRLQLTGKRDLPQIGDAISGRAFVTPLPLPVAPGTFDFGRALFFQSIGGTGRFVSEAQTSADDVPMRYQLRRGFHSLRRVIGDKVRAVIPGPLGSFADALITGERADIPREMNTSLQNSGLFHILSISGLHMALVVGSAFWLMRAGLALSQGLALRRPIKKWAAGVALGVGFFYMLLADSGAATERSFIMVAVVLFAVMVDRPAISLHNLAVAAIIILLFQPEQALAASFQMSFLAVMGLAAFFEWWNRRRQRELRMHEGFVVRWVRRGWVFASASVLTSLIAGTLSGIAAAHHFGRIAPYGVIANAMALPIVSVAVMPMALLAALLMPFGLEALPLAVMEQGLRAVMLISDWVASWPSAALALPLLSSGVAICLTLAAVSASIFLGRARWLALVFVVVGGLWFFIERQPGLYVDERASVVAGRNSGGELVPIAAKQGGFAVKRWLATEGDNASAAIAAKRTLWTCAKSVCSAVINDKTVAFLKDTADPVKPCPLADVIIAQYPLRRLCKGRMVTLDRFDVWRNGAHMIYLGTTLEVVSVRDLQGHRPWTWQPRARKKLTKP